MFNITTKFYESPKGLEKHSLNNINGVLEVIVIEERGNKRTIQIKDSTYLFTASQNRLLFACIDEYFCLVTFTAINSLTKIVTYDYRKRVLH